jgi:hydroxypyruvate reductase
MLAVLQGVVQTALQAADPRVTFCAAAACSPGGRALALPGGARVDLSLAPCAVIVGAGKASVGVAREVAAALSRLEPPLPIHSGLVVTKDGHAGAGDMAALCACGVAVREAAHPVPDARGEAGARELLACISAAPRGAAVFVCLSGGASALLPLPPPGVALADLAALSAALLASGAPIQDLNAVRKHVSAVAGGQLGAAVVARTGDGALVTLVCSDVVGDALHVVGSGPTVPDPTTHGDALRVLEAYGLLGAGGGGGGGGAPRAVVEHLRRGAAGLAPETLKEPLPRHAVATLCSNASATAAAAAALSGAGFHPLVLTNSLEGGAAAAGGVLGTLLAEAALGRGPFAPPRVGGGVALVLGGETTVQLPAGCAGRGGRNQELALAAAVRAGELLRAAADAGAAAAAAAVAPTPWLVCALATDGTDGPTDAAGAVCTSETLTACGAKGLHAEDALRRHDAYTLLAALGGGGGGTAGGTPQVPRIPGREGGLIFTGPSGTNVCDVTIVMLGGAGTAL